MTKIKMCGIRRPEDISFANAVRPDYIGYVFYEKSKRYVTPSAAVRLSSMLDDSIVIVGVFVDAPADEVITLYKSGTIGIAQLHGSEDDNYIMQMKNAGVPTIKAFIIRSEEDIERAEKCPADMVLLVSGKGSAVSSIIRSSRKSYVRISLQEVFPLIMPRKLLKRFTLTPLMQAQDLKLTDSRIYRK